MIEFDPPMSFVSLSKVKLGSLVQWKGKYGFYAETSSERLIVRYDSERSIFTGRTAEDSEVMDFGDKLVIAPVQESFEFLHAEAAATNHLYIALGTPRLCFDRNNKFHVLDLASGGAVAESEKLVLSRFSKWSVGVRKSSGDYLPLIQVDGPSAAATFTALGK